MWKEAENWMVKWCDVKKTQTAIAGFKDEIWACGHSLEDGKDKKMDSPEMNTALLLPWY